MQPLHSQTLTISCSANNLKLVWWRILCAIKKIAQQIYAFFSKKLQKSFFSGKQLRHCFPLPYELHDLSGHHHFGCTGAGIVV